MEHLRLPKNDRFAFYVNVYNAVVLKTVAERFSPGWTVAENNYGIFDEPLVRLSDRQISLNNLEKDLTWNAFKDPRMHVAFVCAAVSCPPLLNRAYQGATMEKTLDDSMRSWLTRGVRNKVDTSSKTLQLSKIFEWYAKDFGGTDAIVSYVDQWHPGDLTGYTISYLEYDWTLNVTR